MIEPDKKVHGGQRDSHRHEVAKEDVNPSFALIGWRAYQYLEFPWEGATSGSRNIQLLITSGLKVFRRVNSAILAKFRRKMRRLG